MTTYEITARDDRGERHFIDHIEASSAWHALQIAMGAALGYSAAQSLAYSYSQVMREYDRYCASIDLPGAEGLRATEADPPEAA